MKPNNTLRHFLALAGSSLIAMSSINAQTLFWSGDGSSQGGSGTWDTSTQLWGADAAGPYDIIWNNTTHANDTAVFGGTAGAVSLGTAITAGGLTFNTNGYSITDGTLTLAGTPVLSAGNNITATISSDLAGSDGLTKSDAGTVILTGTNNTYSGGTIISAGTLQGRKDTEGGASPFGTGAIQLNGGTLGLRTLGDNSNTAQTIIFGNDVTVGGNATINYSRIGGSAANKTHALGNLSIGSNTLTITGNNIGHFLSFTGANLTGNAVINPNGGSFINTKIGAITETGGSRDLTKEGTGVLELLGDNTYTGTTTISSGILEVQGSIASSPSIINNANLKFNSGSARSYGNLISGTGSLTKAGTGTTTLSGSNSYTGATNVQQGTLSINSIADFETNSPIGQGTSGAAIILGNGNNTGTLLYTGGAATTNRTIQVNSSTNTNNGGAAIINNGTGTLTFTATTFNNAYTVTQNSTRLLTLGGSHGGVIDGVIVNNSANSVVALAKTGNGTWTLQGNNIYTGATSVNAGTLLINGDSSAATGTVTVNNDATLGGSGSVGGSVTVTAAANLAPGASVGTFSIGGGLTVSAMAGGAGKLVYELGSIAASDQIAVTGTLNIGEGLLGFSDFDFTNVGGLEEGVYTLITSGGISGSLDGDDLLGTLGGFSATLGTSGNNIILTVGEASGTPFELWAGSGVTFDGDENGDGVSNGLAFLLGAANPNVSALDKPPTATESAGSLVLTFQMLDATARGAATLAIEHSSDLGITDAWTTVAVPASSGTVDDVVFTITGTSPLNVTATIPVDKADAGKLFARLKGQP